MRDLAAHAGRLYLTLDDLNVMEQAVDRPDDLIGRAPRVTIDEIQREPALLRTVKRSSDGAPAPGRRPPFARVPRGI